MPDLKDHLDKVNQQLTEVDLLLTNVRKKIKSTCQEIVQYTLDCSWEENLIHINKDELEEKVLREIERDFERYLCQTSVTIRVM